MRNFLRGSLLAAAMGVGLGGGAITAGTAHAQLQANPALQTWLIEFVEPGLVEFQRDLRGFSGDKFNPREANTVAYMGELMAIQAERKADLERAAGRPIEFTHHYLATHSGMAIRLTAAEADQVARLPGVASVKPEVVEQIDTNAGPVFIGADTIWNGSAIPGGGPGTHPEMHEYLRRLSMAKADYEFLKSELARRFPAERFLIVDIIEPRRTRSVLCEWLDLAADRLRINMESRPRFS